MAKDPAVLFYTSDFFTGTALMTDEQVGKYIRLLCLQHQKGRLSEKDMMKICTTPDEDILSKFSKDENGLFFNERLEQETIKRKAYSNSRRKNREKKNHMNNICLSHDKHMENENEIENRNLNRKEKGSAQILDLFNFYKKVLKRGNTYVLSEGRKQKIIARLKDPPVPGIEWAPDRFTQCQIAICQMSLSDYHQGANDQGKRYVDLVDNCFKSQERVDKWILDAIETEKLGQIRKYLEVNHVPNKTPESEKV